MSEEFNLEEMKKNVKAAFEGQEDLPKDQEEQEDADDEEEFEEQDEQQYTEVEKKAMEMGWNPDKDAVEGDDKEWVPAEEFIRNQKWVNEIKAARKEARQARKVSEAMKQHLEIAQQKAYDKAIADLKAQKKEAAEDQDVVKMLEIDEQIEEVSRKVQEETAASKAKHTADDWDEAYEIFVDENSWYTDNPKMRKYADRVGWDYVQSNPGISPEDAYAYVINEVKEAFPPEAPTKPKKAAAVASGSNRGGTGPRKAKRGISDIPEEHRSIAVTLIKSGELTEEEYLKTYFPEDYS